MRNNPQIKKLNVTYIITREFGMSVRIVYIRVNCTVIFSHRFKSMATIDIANNGYYIL
jgi:hypothetical protein